MTDNTAIVKTFIEAWSRLDADELASFFVEDGVYHNMPFGPISGKANVRDFIQGFIKDWTETQWDVLSLIGDGNIVIAERLDRTKLGAISVDLPCCGVFELEDGKIKVWRDYFDMATYLNAVSSSK